MPEEKDITGMGPTIFEIQKPRMMPDPLDNTKSIEEKKVSPYQPGKEARERTEQVRQDLAKSDIIMNEVYTEFNNRDLITAQNDMQRAFNTYQSYSSDDPDEAWRSNAIRPLTRNKVIQIASRITADVIYPHVFAQNVNDEEDKASANVMQDAMKWASEQSKYERTFMNAVISALVNPAVVLYEGFEKCQRIIKEIKEDGTWESKVVVDEDNSGYVNEIVPLDELYIADPYTADMQKQPYLARPKIIPYELAAEKYGNNDIFNDHVVAGVRTLLNREEGQFYDQFDDSLGERMVEEVIYYNRDRDLELIFINGILIDDPDQPIRRKDKRYPFAKNFYEPIKTEGNFFYGKSLVDKIAPDQDVIDTLYQMVIDGTYMQLMPAMGIFGAEDVDASVTIPGTVTSFSDPDTKMQSFTPANQISTGLSMLQKVESSATESSSDASQAGQSVTKEQTKFEIETLEENSRIILGMFGKMLKFLIEDFGALRVNTIQQHMTVGQMNQITNPDGRLKFQKLVMENQIEGGKKFTKKIEFEPNVQMEEGMSEEQRLEQSFGIMEEQGTTIKNGKLTSDKKIVKVVPSLFRNLRFKVQIGTDFQPMRSESSERRKNLALYDRLIQNPVIDPVAVTTDFLIEPNKPGDSDKYIRKEQPQDDIDGEVANMQKQIKGISGESAEI